MVWSVWRSHKIAPCRLPQFAYYKAADLRTCSICLSVVNHSAVFPVPERSSSGTKSSHVSHSCPGAYSFRAVHMCQLSFGAPSDLLTVRSRAEAAQQWQEDLTVTFNIYMTHTAHMMNII